VFALAFRLGTYGIWELADSSTSSARSDKTLKNAGGKKAAGTDRPPAKGGARTKAAAKMRHRPAQAPGLSPPMSEAPFDGGAAFE
jgi:hypothetical protein